MNFDKITTVDATDSFEARELALKEFPEYYVYTIKSTIGRKKQSLLFRGKLTKYTVYMLKRKKL